MVAGQCRAVVGVLDQRLSLRRGERHRRIVRHDAEQRQPYAVHHVVDRRVHPGKQPRDGPVDDEARRDLTLLQQKLRRAGRVPL